MLPTVEDVAEEVESQLKVLGKYQGTRVRRAAPGALFVGAGDSYSCALAVHFLSSGRVLAVDPYVLLSAPDFAKGREVYFISISGRTRSNIAAAKAVRRLAARTFAITSETASLLARMVEECIELPYSYVPRTPGTLAFALSLLTAIELSCGPISCDFSRMFSAAKKSPDALFSQSGTTYFLGNGPAYAIACYASLKAFEVLGSKAAAELLEEFGHATIFSLQPDDTVNVFSAFDSAKVGRNLASSLTREGFSSRLQPDRGRNRFESTFHAVFASQLSVLREANARKLEYPHLATAEKKLKLSDSMIY